MATLSSSIVFVMRSRHVTPCRISWSLTCVTLTAGTVTYRYIPLYAVQGFQLILDADSGFGGMGAALLTRIRDDYTRAPCLTFGLGACTRPAPPPADSAPSERQTDPHGYAPALNDALSLTAFAELRCSYIPLYGSAAVRAASDTAAAAAEAELLCSAPPLLELSRTLRYHTAAPLALLLHSATLPSRARAPVANLGALVMSLTSRADMYLAAASLALPLPPDARNPPPPVRPPDAAWDGPPLDHFKFDWFRPMAPLQLAPRCHQAHEQARARTPTQNVLCEHAPPSSHPVCRRPRLIDEIARPQAISWLA